MKEKRESYSEDYSSKEKNITINEAEKFKQVLESKEYVTARINKFEPIYINIKIYSFYKINQMFESYPLENISFLFNEIELYTPRSSLNFSKSSIMSNKEDEDDASFSTIKLQSSNKKKPKEVITNTDTTGPFSGNPPKMKNFINIGKDENIDNIKIENELMVNNIKNMKLFTSNNVNNNEKRISVKNTKVVKTSADKKFVLFKWLYHFYIVLSFLIFCHYFTFLFSEYNYENFYKLIAILLILSLASVGYIGIKYKYAKPPLFIFSGEYLFWVHFFILVLTIFTFSALLTTGGHFKFIISQGILGGLISSTYIISLIIEGIYSLYYDKIIEEINWERNNNNMNKINEYIDNKLNIQLTDMN